MLDLLVDGFALARRGPSDRVSLGALVSAPRRNYFDCDCGAGSPGNGRIGFGKRIG